MEELHHIEYSQIQAASSWVSNSSYYRRNFHHKDIHGNGIWPLAKLKQMGFGFLGQFQTLHAGDTNGRAKWVGPDDIQKTNFHAPKFGDHFFPLHVEI